MYVSSRCYDAQRRADSATPTGSDVHHLRDPPFLWCAMMAARKRSPEMLEAIREIVRIATNRIYPGSHPGETGSDCNMMQCTHAYTRVHTAHIVVVQSCADFHLGHAATVSPDCTNSNLRYCGDLDVSGPGLYGQIISKLHGKPLSRCEMDHTHTEIDGLDYNGMARNTRKGHPGHGKFLAGKSLMMSTTRDYSWCMTLACRTRQLQDNC
jgi:hypothetical protein